VTVDGVVQPAPAPRFDATPGAVQGPPPAIGGHNMSGLRDWGFAPERVQELKSKGVI
jgi:alpha-methylacyl-CoA racemase